MASEPYSKREIDRITTDIEQTVKAGFDNIDRVMKQHQKNDQLEHEALRGALERLTEQVKLTNGRVKKLELWKAGLVGATGVLSLIVVPILVYLITTAL